jgi:CRP-like cAMP-binding protein
MLDDGQIEKLGPVSYTKAFTESSEKEPAIPVIRGPLVDYMYVVDEEEYYDGDRIVAEGKFGNWIWTILEGTVEIVKETPHGTITIMRLTNGSFVGSISGVTPGQHVRSASAVAAGTVQLGLLDSQRLYGEYTKLSNDCKEMIKSLDNRLKKQTALLIDINSGKVKINEMLSGKKMFIEQGTNNTNAYMITEGEALIARITKNGYLPILSLSAGDFIGHIPFINIGQEPHSASVFASRDLKTGPIDIENINKEYDQLSVTFKNILENLITCISATTMVASEMYKKSVVTKK